MKLKLAIFPTAVAALALGALTVPALAQAGPHLSWSGNVDETVSVTLHGDHVATNTVRGKVVNDVNEQVVGRLPMGPCIATLQDVHGRGSIRITQQPSPNNNFTVRVRVNDPEAGSGHYHFVLVWQPGPGGRDGFGGPGHPGGPGGPNQPGPGGPR